LYNTQFNEHYHSIHGALQESLHVFIKNGLKTFNTPLLNIFEMGFGTGLNALLTLQNMPPNGRFFYHTIDLFPLETKQVLNLNYREITFDKANMLEKIHQADWSKQVAVNKNFTLLKEKVSLLDSRLSDNFYDLIYFDAFSPEKQPELWSINVFEKLHKAMKNQSILVTYCAKGYVKRNLMAAGFQVEKLQGPPGKREMIRAKKV